MDRELTVAIAQIVCLDGDRSGNFLRIENAIQDATSERADIVCFPETAILGWANPDAHQRADAIPGKDADRLCDLARRYGIYMSVGLAEKDGDKLYDSAILIDDQGRILLKHRKLNILTELMQPPYTLGSGVTSVETKFGKIGLLICADTFDKQAIQAMAQQQPDLLIVPYGWANKEAAWPEHGKSLEDTVSRAAKAIKCPVIGTNLVGMVSNGPWSGMVYGGQSVAVNIHGSVLGIARDRDREILVLPIE